MLGIFIDGLRIDFISKEYMPYLYKFSQDNPCMKLGTILGYSDAIDASIFTGTYPDTNGYWMKYQYSPDTSPFKNMKNIKYLKTIDNIPSNIIKSGINYILFNTYYKKIAKDTGINGFATHNIPYNLLNNFDFSLYKSLYGYRPFKDIPTIFDILNDNDMDSCYLHKIRSDDFEELRKVSLGIIYLNDIDLYAHIFGLRSKIFLNRLKNLDKKIKHIIEKYEKIEKDGNIMIFSDHGMAQVDRILNFDYLLHHKEYNKKFFMVIDGTMLRFWYIDKNFRSIIRSYLDDKYCGHFLDNKEKRRLHIDFAHNRYFEDVYLLKQGYAIFPNFMSWNIPKAMHAYHPDYQEQNGVLILKGNVFGSIKKRDIYIVDIMPTILESLNVDVPTSVEGESVVK